MGVGDGTAEMVQLNRLSHPSMRTALADRQGPVMWQAETEMAIRLTAPLTR